MNDSFDIYSEFDLDAAPIEDPIDSYITNRMDMIPENLNIIKESSLVNGFELTLAMDEKAQQYVLIFTGPRSIVNRYMNFYLGNDREIRFFHVMSIDEQYENFYYGDIQQINIRNMISSTKFYNVRVYPEPYEVDTMSGKYMDCCF